MARAFPKIYNCRDQTIFVLMMRCELRVEEVDNLSPRAVDWVRTQLFIYEGKCGRDRFVYLSSDTLKACTGSDTDQGSCMRPAVNAAVSDNTSIEDILGNSKLKGPLADIGAYE